MDNENIIPLVALIMGSQSDWETMKFSEDTLLTLKIPFITKIISAHRTPERMYKFASESENNKIQIIIAGAGGAAHLPGMVASHTNVPVIGVPIESSSLKGMDSLLSIVQMPGGVPVATMSIGKAGAINAAIYAAKILSLSNVTIKNTLNEWILTQTNNVPITPNKNND
ncbi:MAG: 5-(carboxyamino)imidazole ribonucleotide mutase [Alphaproteobacteria bacterium]|jgi:5-(carboxyamino)imidazole ribonucleotide mutase|nr:5-(carboxyamino)imidazole ribonucleotide mutase [Alphaproteobacteria bacterium]MDG1882104.1 5-(carboxyamino)imidazole ribonucleotide mutase [Alphaproteobacteria bacterium]MDG2458616.1 5-(carboxyamino)imidazole ribonucleotide mutase [Alphaproteobacteria bacterium]|tara:strand:- start:268 stop:774 length:507 start_codon:yes stop_codon:yes gene_type:complete